MKNLEKISFFIYQNLLNLKDVPPFDYDSLPCNLIK